MVSPLFRVPPSIGPIRTPLKTRPVQPTPTIRAELEDAVEETLAVWRADFIGPAWYAGFDIIGRSAGPDTILIGPGIANILDASTHKGHRVESSSTLIGAVAASEQIIGLHIVSGGAIATSTVGTTIPVNVVPLYYVHKNGSVWTIRDLRLRPGVPRHRYQRGEWDVLENESIHTFYGSADLRAQSLVRGDPTLISPMPLGPFYPHEVVPTALTAGIVWKGTLDIGAAYVHPPGGVLLTADFDIDRANVKKSDWISVAFAGHNAAAPNSIAAKFTSHRYVREKKIKRGTHVHMEWVEVIDGFTDLQGLVLDYLRFDTTQDGQELEGLQIFDTEITMTPFPARQLNWA